MSTVIIIITAVIILFLGVRLVMKLREMATWRDNDPVIDGKPTIGLPSDLRELKIEEPSDDISGSPDQGGKQKPTGNPSPRQPS